VLETFLIFIISPLQIGGISFSFSPLQALLRFFLPLIILFAFYKLFLFLIKRLILKPLKIKEELKKRVFKRIRLLFRIAVFAVLLFLVLSFFEAEIQSYVAIVWDILNNPFFTAGSSRISIITIILTIPIFYLASWLTKISRKFMDTAILSKLSVSSEMRFSISTLIRYGIMVLTVLVGLSIIGINLSSLAVIFGVLGIGLGFGLQNMVANFMAGVIIIFERPIKEGDRILVNNLEGDVVHIRLRSTIINTLTNETIIVPNNQLVGNSIHNYSYQDRRIVIINPVQVAYESDLDLVEKVLLEMVEKSPYALTDPRAHVKIMAFEDSGILVELWSWIGEATQKLAAKAWNNLEIWRSFKEAGITIPFPQVDLHVKEPPQL
jgi:small-conductance mechanosensitive channel